jgi:hypothetical protein
MPGRPCVTPWHAAGKLRHGADFARRHLDQRREALQRLVRREQVVIGRNDRYIRPDEAAQRLLVALAGGGKTMGEIGTAEPRPRGPCTARAAHAAEIVVARVLAARADARGDRGDFPVQRRDREFRMVHEGALA